MAGKCKAKSKNGRDCRAYAINDSDYCVGHSPEIEARRLDWCSQGGKKIQDVRANEKRKRLSKRGVIYYNDLNTVLVSLNEDKFAVIDAADWDTVKEYDWYYNARPGTPGGCVQEEVRTHIGEGKYISMPHVILCAPPGRMIVNKNGDRLDCRRHNLMIVGPACRARKSRKTPKPTTSKYKGVYWAAREGKWEAHITFNYKKIYLKRYTDEKEAARAYDKAAQELFGECAVLNFPVKQTRESNLVGKPKDG